ncbi:MAG: helix-turn-helix domain-containing protein [Burkholderiaceae bacterium]|nr:helix-turn-helix domain-containing protein [Burkholderiaceae bacterium]
MSNQITELISKASAITGSDYALAAQLGVPRQMVSMWKKEARPCPPEEQARIADIAGFDPVEALVNAVLERHAGTPKGEALCRVLKRQRGQNKKPPELLQGASVGGNG